MIFLTLGELLHVAGRATGTEVQVRDHGLLASAAARPQATAFGQDAYPSLEEEAAALLHSLARHHARRDDVPAVDGRRPCGQPPVMGPDRT